MLYQAMVYPQIMRKLALSKIDPYLYLLMTYAVSWELVVITGDLLIVFGYS